MPRRLPPLITDCLVDCCLPAAAAAAAVCLRIDAKNIEMLSSLAPHYVEVHSYNKTVAGFNATLAAFLIGAQANAFWNLGPGAWQCDDWDVRAHYSTVAIFINFVVCRRVACLLKRKGF